MHPRVLGKLSSMPGWNLQIRHHYKIKYVIYGIVLCPYVSKHFAHGLNVVEPWSLHLGFRTGSQQWSVPLISGHFSEDGTQVSELLIDEARQKTDLPLAVGTTRSNERVVSFPWLDELLSQKVFADPQLPSPENDENERQAYLSQVINTHPSSFTSDLGFADWGAGYLEDLEQEVNAALTGGVAGATEVLRHLGHCRVVSDFQTRRFPEIQIHVADIQPVTLEEYRALLEPAAKPSLDVIAAYVDKVSNDHSWYKKLPFLPPGEPFQFYIGPQGHYWPAGFNRMNPRAVISVAQGLEPHYVADHFSMFRYGGVFDKFWRGSLRSEDAPDYCHLPVIADRNGLFRIPYEVHEHGQIRLTSVVHDRAAYAFQATYGRHNSPEQRAENEERHFGANPDDGWPIETGGAGVLSRMVQRATMSGNSTGCEGDKEIEGLIRPERQRLRGLMMSRIEHIAELVWFEHVDQSAGYAADANPASAHRYAAIRYVVSRFIGCMREDRGYSLNSSRLLTDALRNRLERRYDLWGRVRRKRFIAQLLNSNLVRIEIGRLTDDQAEVLCFLDKRQGQWQQQFALTNSKGIWQMDAIVGIAE